MLIESFKRLLGELGQGLRDLLRADLSRVEQILVWLTIDRDRCPVTGSRYCCCCALIVELALLAERRDELRGAANDAEQDRRAETLDIVLVEEARLPCPSEIVRANRAELDRDAVVAQETGPDDENPGLAAGERQSDIRRSAWFQRGSTRAGRRRTRRLRA